MCGTLNARARMERARCGNPFAFEEERELRIDRGTKETRRKKRCD